MCLEFLFHTGLLAKTDTIFRFILLPQNIKTHFWKSRAKRNFWWDLKKRFWMSPMIKNMITLSFSFWHYENFAGFFIPKWKEIWLSLEMCHMQFSDIFVLVPSNCFPPLFLSEGGRHICNRFPVWGNSLRVLSPVPGVSSVAALKQVFAIKIIQFFPQKVTHKSSFLSNSWLSLSVINALGESEGKDTNL